MKKILFVLLLVSFCLGQVIVAQDKPLNIIAVFAHPDDADGRIAGMSIKWAKMGHRVKFVSLTNGDGGSYTTGGARLAQRRRAESAEAGRRYGIAEYKTLDNHDTELMPTLEVRKQVIREIREWNADIVIGLRPNDYHPDHRYAGVLVMDAAYMVVVPNIVSDVPALEKNPVFLYMKDRFTKPYPFEPEITVIVDDVYEQIIDGNVAHVSQYFEWLPWVAGNLDEVPEGAAARREWFKNNRKGRTAIDSAMRANLVKWYGAEKANKAVHAETLEIAEYGRQPSDEEIKKLFPMLGE
jgi:LmbE family N-acetylglucosaminyl deacetylase